MVSRSEGVLGETVSSHDTEHFVNLGRVVSGGVVDKGVEIMHKPLVEDKLGHVTGVHGHVGLEHCLHFSDPAEVGSLHGADIGLESFSKLSRVDVLLKDGEDLVEEFLLMQIVELQDGVHLVDD